MNWVYFFLGMGIGAVAAFVAGVWWAWRHETYDSY